MTRVEQAQQTRKKLFDAAYALLQERPFEEITIRDIVKEAGVSIGTFYLYFPSKMDVYYETYELADKYFADVVTPMLTMPTAYENLLIYFDQYAFYNSDYTSLRLTKLLYNSENVRFLRRNSPGMQSVLHELISAGQQNGEIVTDLPADKIETFLMRSIRGLVYSWCLSNGSYNLRTATKEHLDLLFRAIRA